MKHNLIALLLLLPATGVWAQTEHAVAKTNSQKEYRATPEKINDLVHTKLEAKLDYTKSQLNGKVWLTLKPHFYATDSLLLDAKGMEIREVALVKNGRNTPLKHTNNGLQVNIDLDRSYRGNEQYTIYIDYTAKPNEYKGQGSAAITDAKGLYFINPKGEEKNKPTQVWTQGETEGTSVWVPTIDRPNQKTTQEFYLTVPAKYVSLSNGKLVSQKTNSDGTRTDYWKMDQPHAPYLFFIGVGDYAVIKDSYKGKEVSYYVEKEYGPVAKRIFGNTPEMMQYFSTITGVDYPWVKYAQMTARDYVSGAMENTTATLHQESAQQDARELVDENRWEGTIAHELFHQWFGDYVTTESWSNLTLNESFANYSEYLWSEYKYGKDAADEHNYEDMQGYLMSGSENKDLVRFDYNDKEDMFDAVSYNKGGRILHMLRNHLGDSAFFKGLNLYLTTNKFKSAEAHQLRLAFEEVSGKDLNWFFNQWYFNNGHPKLEITNTYDNAAKRVQVIVRQTQDSNNVFRLPVAIDVYQGNNRTRHNVWVDSRTDTFYLAAPTKPSLVNFDAEKILLAQKKETKTMDEYGVQFRNARNFMDRFEALSAALKKQEEQKAVEIINQAISDPYQGIREMAVSGLDLKKQALRTLMEEPLYKLAQNDKSKKVKAAAISKLSEYGFAKYATLYKTAVNDSSYTVAGAALSALSELDSTAAYTEAKRLMGQPAKGDLGSAIAAIMIGRGDVSAAEMIISNFEQMPLSQEKVQGLMPLAQYLTIIDNMDQFKRGVNALAGFVGQLPAQYREQFKGPIENMLRQIQTRKTAAGQQAQAAYVGEKIDENKKAF
ncbi:aminopeptidase N [Cnuella takakiae]|uniref:Aminopeptidase N n=1 Tax=Cnuella takakiae TaxID=1302690 RepID=A0A1M5ATF2_9BACT|nr:M1 family aminopeptidase [Cnuella takakiae]OLY93221.1 peptidase M1 [Cnuella takakiae]SHF33538.1 aminopeptidase N [Cnuella takakiae]